MFKSVFTFIKNSIVDPVVGEPQPMTEREIKRHLQDNGFRISDLAIELHNQFEGVSTVRSADTMLRQLIAGHRWYPVYAKWLADNYGVIVEKPSWLKPVRDRMRLAA